MVDEWREEPLSTLCSYLNRGAAPAYTETGGLLVLNQKCVRDQRVDFNEARRTDPDQKSVADERVLRPLDILVNSTGVGTLGRVAQVRELPEQTTVDSHVTVLRPDPKAIDPLYLGMAVRCFESEIEALGEGSTGQTELSRTRLGAFVVPVPSRKEQRAIARILGALDDKIEANRRMNETLEAIARALFKSRFIESSQDGMPREWGRASFAETVAVLGGGTPKTSTPEYWGGDIPWFSVVDAPFDSDVFVIDTEKKITSAGVENSAAQILPEGTTIISARGTVGRVALTGRPMAINQSCYGLRGKVGKRGFYTYFATRALVNELRQRVHGSVFDTITRDTLAGVEVSVPPDAQIEEFERTVAPFLGRIRGNLLESRTLAALRDALLPKLLSGEIRVKNTEEVTSRDS